MAMTSKTGLLPCINKNIRIQIQEARELEIPKLVGPAPFTTRPFAGVYNPFPYGCSVLCNHPADFEIRTIVKKAKDAWALEGKSIIDVELSARKPPEKHTRQNLPFTQDVDDMVPEELFRKYTETDSRPVTPTPTLISVGTKTSQMFKTRRCMTPDPAPGKEKMLLVLDLRRSHSQETVNWQGNQLPENNFENVLQEADTSRTTSTLSPKTSYFKRKKTLKKKTPSTTSSHLQSQTSKDLEPKAQHSSARQSPPKEFAVQEQDFKVSAISPESTSGDLGIIKRRGKKKKGKKAGKGDKEFQGILDPGETQISAMENDFKESSSRASLENEYKGQGNQLEEINLLNSESKPEELENTSSFLSKEVLKQLQRQLDQEVVDTELNAKRKMALEEALRYKKYPKQIQQGEEMKRLKKEFQLLIKNSEKWLSIPRGFTRRSVRFEIPMDSRLLNGMTPLHYVQNYVFPSHERLVLYNHVFNLYKEEPEDDEEKDRILLGKNVKKALNRIMGIAIPDKEAKDFQNLLDWKDDESINFRTFTGISAACERLLGPLLCSKIRNQKEDPRHEVERADFETLEGKMRRLNPDRRLVKILKGIRDL